MTETEVRTVIALAPFLLILTGLAFTVMIDLYIRRSHRRIMLLIVALTVCVVLQNGLGYLLEVEIVHPAVRTWNAAFGYSVRPVILLLFLMIVGVGCRTWPFWPQNIDLPNSWKKTARFCKGCNNPKGRLYSVDEILEQRDQKFGPRE